MVENVGTFTISILKKTREEIIVGVRTVEGTAKEVEDYIPFNEIIKVSYLEYKIEIKIVDDDVYEPDEEFYIELYNPITKKRLIGEDTVAKVVIVDDAK